LPAEQFRSGHELRCEVVHPMKYASIKPHQGNTLEEAICEAMVDMLETGSFSKHNPCIYLYADSYHYGSGMEPHDACILDLNEGFGNWTPGVLEEIKPCSEGLAIQLQTGQP
jgi:hypothetical protein